jgi:hypothetical protein
MQDRDVDSNRRKSGIGGGTIAAIVAALLLIIGALYTWGPWSTNGTHDAANPAPATSTVGQGSSGPGAATPAPANTTPGPTNR